MGKPEDKKRPKDKKHAEEFLEKQKALVDALHARGELTAVEKAKKLIEELKRKEQGGV